MKLLKDIERTGCEYLVDFPMKRYTSMRVGGTADTVVYPRTSTELIKVLNLLRSLNVPWMVLGGGSNLVVRDGGIRSVVVSTKRIRRIELLKGNRVYAEAGAVLGSVLNFTLRAGLAGLEFAAGIPGTVGGGIIMNAGANRGEMKDVVEEVHLWLDGEEVSLRRDEIEFEYRRSHLPEGAIVVGVEIALSSGGMESGKLVRAYLSKRWRTQPVEVPSAGCMFKNPKGIPAGRLLDELGFKGFQIGGAKFSEMHANYIVNLGGAIALDIINLVEIARREILLRRGMELDMEVKTIGEDKE